MLNPGLIIRRYRLERGISQAELARLAGLAQSNLSHIEKGTRDLTVATLGRLATALGVPPACLLEEPCSPAGPRMTRTRIEALAEAVVNPSSVSDGELRELADIVRRVLGRENKRESTARLTEAWFALRGRLTDHEIRGLEERVRDARQRL